MPNRTTNILIKPFSISEKDVFNLKQYLAEQTWSMFLESADTGHIDSNWCIYTAEPIATLTEQAGQVLLNDYVANTRHYFSDDPLTVQSQIRQKLFHAESTSTYPFTGGVIAAYHYEMGERFESLSKSSQNEGLNLGPFHCGFYDWALLYHVNSQQYFLMQHRCKNQSLDLEQAWQQRALWLREVMPKQSMPDSAFTLIADWQANYSKQQYTQAFDRIQEYILSGDCYQVNLAQRFQCQYNGNEYLAYQALQAENKAPFAAFIRLPEQVIISVSPERFLQSDQNQIQTKPIKGTVPRGQNPADDLANKKVLMASEKDQSENLMIVDLLRNDIGRVCMPGSVAVPKLFDIESFPAVHHLVSTVTGQLDPSYTCEDLLRAAFPGGSITGAPKIRAMEIIDELEQYQREIYCGSITYINGNGDMDSSITIRTLVCKDSQIYCWAGGGIVADSQADDEYQECFDKVSKILPILSQLNKRL